MKILKGRFESKYQLTAGDTNVRFMKSGDLFSASFNGITLNQVWTNEIDGSINNLYLRVFEEDGTIEAVPMIGSRAESEMFIATTQVKWVGTFKGIAYTVYFKLSNRNVWFWDVYLEGDGQRADVIYAQDVGLADINALQANEAYLAQYVDHKVFEDEERGFIVCSRQNQGQGGRNPYLQQGSLHKTIGYETDGFRFYGLSYKDTDVPEGLKRQHCSNTTYQYEFDFTVLQSDQRTITDTEQFTFYTLWHDDHPTAITQLEFQDEVSAAWEMIEQESFEWVQSIYRKPSFGMPLQTETLTNDEIEERYPVRLQNEYEQEELLSFFTPTREHVVLKAKELQVERPHGHILISGNHLTIDQPVMTTTSYMYGVFNSQIVLGNTTMNKFISNPRNPLNVLKTSGQRIYVKIGDVYQQFAMPSAYEMGFNYAEWTYKTTADTFIIRTMVSSQTDQIQLEMKALSGKAYEFLVTQQVVMNDSEYKADYRMEQVGGSYRFTAQPESVIASHYPDLCYTLTLHEATASVVDETFLLEHATSGESSLFMLAVEACDHFAITMQGSLSGDTGAATLFDGDVERETYRQHFKQLMNGFELQGGSATDELEKMNTTAWWYTHNMLIHYLSPHGLEQYGGAAWGTRDVCQGPVEYFSAVQRFDIVKQILATVFSHQFIEDGNWPQWFMFDRYAAIQASESHGDIIVWPLKAISDYLNATGDYSILDLEVPYMSRETFRYTEQTETIYAHVLKEIKYIEEHFLFDTHLSIYGDGDWDDTLQPANKKLKTQMASSWTIALTYQTMKQMARALEEYDTEQAQKLARLADAIKVDFNQYILSTDVIPGFVYMEDKDSVELMIHPEDKKTGIQYRLLPMTRSIIAELVSDEQAHRNYELIQRELRFADGVRLMNKPANYQGGVSVHFQRAEQAANFGREIGLLYVHAQIRYAEAMAKIGEAKEAWEALSLINPVQITEKIKHAEKRQSNAYFSSSDGAFATRAEAADRFDELKTGDVSVKGGWRVYSSGPGIYMNQLITNLLGLRVDGQDLIIDPMLDAEMLPLTFKFSYQNNPIAFRYVAGETFAVDVNGQHLTGEKLVNPYREAGVKLTKEALLPHLQTSDVVVTITIPQKENEK